MFIQFIQFLGTVLALQRSFALYASEKFSRFISVVLATCSFSAIIIALYFHYYYCSHLPYFIYHIFVMNVVNTVCKFLIHFFKVHVYF